MIWNKTLSDLQFHLATLFPLKDDILPVAGKAGIPLATLTVSDKGIVFWYHVLTDARKLGLLDDVIAEAIRIFPNDEILSSFNALLIDKDQEVQLNVLKELCADILREGQFQSALPILEEIVERSPSGQGLEENLVVRFAATQRHQNDVEQLTGRKRARSLRFLDSSTSDLIALLHAL